MMYRPAARSLLRQSLRTTIQSTARRRFLSTAPPAQKSRSWKSSTIRWGLAVAGIYYYNTSNVFAEEPAFSTDKTPAPEINPEPLLTLDALTPSTRAKQLSPSSASAQTATATDLPSTTDLPPTSQQTPEDLEADASQQGAFNEETGEINWDCPCLGGMAHGPCGAEFREAFSCFVYSKEEPKGMDCIDRFRGMQDCFRQHPDVYGGELEDGEEDEMEGAEMAVGGEVPGGGNEGVGADAGEEVTRMKRETQTRHVDRPQGEGLERERTEKAKRATAQVRSEHEPLSESEELVPKAAHDTMPSASEGEK